MNLAEQIVFILSLLAFYSLGRHAGHERDIAASIGKKIKKKIRPSGGMVITAPTPEELVYNDSYERRVDEERERVFKESFNPIKP